VARLLLSVGLLFGLFLSLGLLTAPAEAAAIPRAFTVSGVTATSAMLTWTSTGAIGYRVYRGPATAPDSAMTLIDTTDADVVQYTAGDLRSNFGYKFAVAGLDLDNSEGRTAVETVTTSASHDTTAPAMPGNQSVLATAFSSSRIDVVWAASSSEDVAYYEVLRNGVVVGTLERPLATKFSDNGLSPSTTYSYQVRAVDSAGNRSGLTAEKSPRTLSAGAAEIARGPYAVRVDAGSATIEWWTNIPVPGSVIFEGKPAVTDGATRQHRVTVKGLAPGSQYSYTVTGGSATATGTVRTAAPPGKPFAFTVVGDYGAGTLQEQQNAANIVRYDSDFVQTVGDNIYPSSGFPDPDFATQASDLDYRVFKQLGGVLRTQAFFPANGNHEYFADGQWWTAFSMPGTNHSWYSYNWGAAHILVLDTMQPYTPTSDQYAFAERDLASAAAKDARWQIVVLPSPAYNSTTSATGGTSSARTGLVTLFEQNGVDLVFSGDAHNYQRSKPLRGGKAAAGGITYVVTGGGGNGTNKFTGTLPDWQAARAAEFHTVKVEVSPKSLKLSAILASDGRVIDSATLSAATSTADAQAPTPPTAVKGRSTGNSVSLSWAPSTDNVGVDHYNVYRDDGTKPIGSSPTAGFNDPGRAPSTTYRYAVAAVDAAGNESAKSAPATPITTAGGTDSGGGQHAAALLLATAVGLVLAGTVWSMSRRRHDGRLRENVPAE
jgi:fibronectin type 3 domain-containing protein